MKKEIITTIIIIMLICALYMASQNYTNSCVAFTNQKLSRIKSDVIEDKKDNEELKKETDILYDTWKEKSKLLAFYIEHEELEKIDTQLKIVKANFEANSPENSIPEIEQGIYLLEHIEEKRALKLKNIF